MPFDGTHLAPALARDAFVAALRSGSYRQCAGTLHRDGAYCAIGVLNVIFGRKIAALGENDDYCYEFANALPEDTASCS